MKHRLKKSWERMRKKKAAVIVAGAYLVLLVSWAVYLQVWASPNLVMMVRPRNATEFWSMATALATVGLILTAWLGLRSLFLSRTDMITRATREARACAIQRCEEFARHLITKNSPILDAFALNKVPRFVHTHEDARFDPDNRAKIPEAQQWYGNLSGSLRVQCIDFLNELEAWSMYFTNQLADSDVAYGPCARPFCSAVLQLYPVLLLMRTAESSGGFPNVVKLYKAWISQQSSADIDNMMATLARRQNQAAEAALPKALGTTLDD